eukprot:g5532.t1
MSTISSIKVDDLLLSDSGEEEEFIQQPNRSMTSSSLNVDRILAEFSDVEEEEEEEEEEEGKAPPPTYDDVAKLAETQSLTPPSTSIAPPSPTQIPVKSRVVKGLIDAGISPAIAERAVAATRSENDSEESWEAAFNWAMVYTDNGDATPHVPRPAWPISTDTNESSVEETNKVTEQLEFRTMDNIFASVGDVPLPSTLDTEKERSETTTSPPPGLGTEANVPDPILTTENNSIQKLIDMGFKEAQAQRSLTLSSGNFSQAMELLLSGAIEEEEQEAKNSPPISPQSHLSVSPSAASSSATSPTSSTTNEGVTTQVHYRRKSSVTIDEAELSEKLLREPKDESVPKPRMPLRANVGRRASVSKEGLCRFETLSSVNTTLSQFSKPNEKDVNSIAPRITALTVDSRWFIIGLSNSIVVIYDHFHQVRASYNFKESKLNEEQSSNTNDENILVNDVEVSALSISPDSDLLLIGYQDGTLVLFDILGQKDMCITSLAPKSLDGSKRDKTKRCSLQEVLFLPKPNSLLAIVLVATGDLLSVKFRRLFNWGKLSASVEPVLISNSNGIAQKAFAVSIAHPPPSNSNDNKTAPPLIAITTMSPEQCTVLLPLPAPGARPKYKPGESVIWSSPLLPPEPGSPTLQIMLRWKWNIGWTTPQLAIGYGPYLQILHMEPRRGFVVASQHKASTSIVALQWVRQDLVLFMTMDRKLSAFDTQTAKLLMTADIASHFTTPVANYTGGASSISKSMFFVELIAEKDFQNNTNLERKNQQNVQAVHLRSDTERLSMYIGNGKWIAALALGSKLCRGHYDEARGLLETFIRTVPVIQNQAEESGEKSSFTIESVACTILNFCSEFKMIENPNDISIKLLELSIQLCESNSNVENSFSGTNALQELANSIVVHTWHQKIAAPSPVILHFITKYCDERHKKWIQGALIHVQWTEKTAKEVIPVLCELQLSSPLAYVALDVIRPPQFSLVLTTMSKICLEKRNTKEDISSKLLLLFSCLLSGVRFPPRRKQKSLKLRWGKREDLSSESKSVRDLIKAHLEVDSIHYDDASNFDFGEARYRSRDCIEASQAALSLLLNFNGEKSDAEIEKKKLDGKEDNIHITHPLFLHLLSIDAGSLLAMIFPHLSKKIKMGDDERSDEFLDLVMHLLTKVTLHWETKVNENNEKELNLKNRLIEIYSFIARILQLKMNLTLSPWMILGTVRALVCDEELMNEIDLKKRENLVMLQVSIFEKSMNDWSFPNTFNHLIEETCSNVAAAGMPWPAAALAARCGSIENVLDIFLSTKESKDKSNEKSKMQMKRAAFVYLSEEATRNKNPEALDSFEKILHQHLEQLILADCDATAELFQRIGHDGLPLYYYELLAKHHPRRLLPKLRGFDFKCSDADLNQCALACRKEGAYDVAAELRWRDGVAKAAEDELISGIENLLDKMFEEAETKTLDKATEESVEAILSLGAEFCNRHWERERIEKAENLWSSLLQIVLQALVRIVEKNQPLENKNVSENMNYEKKNIEPPRLSRVGTGTLYSDDTNVLAGTGNFNLQNLQNDEKNNFDEMNLFHEKVKHFASLLLTDCRGDMPLSRVLYLVLHAEASLQLPLKELRGLIDGILKNLKAQKCVLNAAKECASASRCRGRLVTLPQSDTKIEIDFDKVENVYRKDRHEEIDGVFLRLEIGEKLPNQVITLPTRPRGAIHSHVPVNRKRNGFIPLQAEKYCYAQFPNANSK